MPGIESSVAFAAGEDPSHPWPDSESGTGSEASAQAVSASDSDPSGEIPQLPPVTVVAPPEEPALTGRSVLARETIEVLPKDNGSINELLKVLPGVQFGEESRTSYNGGDILPPDVSIAGGKVFQNNFQIDGFSNDSYSDPTWEGASSPINLPGHPQTLFLDADLIDAVHLYDHNISAEYGGFTGGVIDARTRDPGPEFGGSLYYRTTRDEWTELQVDPEKEEEFENSRSSNQQPRFEKHDAGATFNLPLGPRRGILASYQRLQSTIPLHWLDGEKTERRSLENFFGKYLHTFKTGDALRLTLIHAPYEEDRFYKDSLKGGFSLAGESSTATLSWQHLSPLGQVELLGGYRRSETRRSGVPYLNVWLNTPSRDWGGAGESADKSFEGGPGSLETRQAGWEAAFTVTLDELPTGRIHHRVRFGAGRERIEAVIERPAEWVNGQAMDLNIDQVDCPPEDAGCIEGEQYLFYRLVQPAGRVGATIDLYSAFIENRMRLGRLEVRPGLRFSYDDFMRNRHAAPRLAASLDVFGNGGTLLIAGRNRYYGKTLLAYKLREMSRPYFQTRTFADLTWSDPKDLPVYRFSELDTPRTDETVFGLDQRIWGGLARLRYIERDGQKEFAREYDSESKTYFLNNNGSSRHRQYRVAWERWWRRHYLAINATYQKTRYSNEDYSDTFDLDDVAQEVWYNGDLLPLHDLPRRDFNRPWVGNLVYSVRLPKGLAFTNVTRYRGDYIGLDSLDKGEKEARDIPVTTVAYERERKPESWIFDWKLSWRRELGKQSAVQVDLEINNVFNRKVETGGGGGGIYEAGRQLWVGAKLDF